MNVYVVFGSTGEYSDHTEWGVAAFMKEKQAQAHVELASSRARELRVLERDGDCQLYDDPHFYDLKRSLKNEYDPNMQVDYTGVRYRYYALPLMRKAGQLEGVNPEQ